MGVQVVPQDRDVVLQGGEGVLGQGVPPQHVGQAVLGHGAAALHEQQLEHLLCLCPAKVAGPDAAGRR